MVEEKDGEEEVGGRSVGSLPGCDAPELEVRVEMWCRTDRQKIFDVCDGGDDGRADYPEHKSFGDRCICKPGGKHPVGVVEQSDVL